MTWLSQPIYLWVGIKSGPHSLIDYFWPTDYFNLAHYHFQNSAHFQHLAHFWPNKFRPRFSPFSNFSIFSKVGPFSKFSPFLAY
jgi:hypothetical protein